MRSIRLFLVLAAVILAGLSSVAPAHARQSSFFIDIQPDAGPPGTTVVISGRGAPPNTAVRVLYAPFDNLADCRTGRDASTVAEIRANANGQFTATHLARQSTAQHRGNTYLARLNEGSLPRPSSDLECFTFQGTPGQGRYFPETGYSVGGRFLEFWEQNGGLYVFGYPLTNEFQADGRTTQYFERARFELFPENQPPYDVQLGRLGVEALQRRGIDWWTQPASPGPVAGCLYFEQTRHNVCNQQRGIGFLNTWTSNGLTFRGQPGVTYAESLALFGYPITEPYQYTTDDGSMFQVQWFERARFEWHPGNPVAYRVLLGRLGAELQPQAGPPVFERVNLYFVAQGDAGRRGKQIGCGDSIIPVEVPVEPTTAPLTAALGRLFALDDQFYGQSGLYNALYQSDLRLDRAVVEQGRATIELSGNLRLGGVCDNPRVEAQIKEVARQFSTVNEVVVFLNGQRLEDVLSQR